MNDKQTILESAKQNPQALQLASIEVLIDIRDTLQQILVILPL